MTEEVKTEQQTITIDGKEYVFDDLNDEAKGAVVQLMDINQSIQRAQAQVAQFEMARSGFNTVLANALAEDDGEEAGVEIDTGTTN